MTAEELTRIIESKIGENGDISNPHGVDLRRCLVPPEKKTYACGFPMEGDIDLWLVLEEDPEKQSGYKIIYHEESDMFGLAMRGFPGGPDVFIGLHGTFLDALEGM